MQDSIQKLAGTYLKDVVSILVCDVDSVDKDNRTCDCTPVGGDASTKVPSVQLCAENDDGFIVFPKVGSTVIVGLSTRNTAFVIMYSGVDSVQFMDGSLGGLTKTLELQLQLNKLNAQLQAVVTSLTSWTPVANDGGAALKAYFATQISGKLPGDFSQIENTLIKQGV